ncbi:hypothetical protein B0G77_5303 [Paraburkholderia sp. BL10I2N1]|nr:hypothetical protein B0G77_5303 [Paraburkholderia sp. BL10I2N1]
MGSNFSVSGNGIDKGLRSDCEEATGCASSELIQAILF